MVGHVNANGSIRIIQCEAHKDIYTKRIAHWTVSAIFKDQIALSKSFSFDVLP